MLFLFRGALHLLAAGSLVRGSLALAGRLFCCREMKRASFRITLARSLLLPQRRINFATMEKKERVTIYERDIEEYQEI